MKLYSEGKFTGERALYALQNAKISDSVFADGESPLKESSDIELSKCIFAWKYPLWYSKRITLLDCTLLDTARSGIWYTDDISMTKCNILAPKTFRRSSRIKLTDVNMLNALETMWGCRNVEMENVSVKGDYFAMNSESVHADGLYIDGNYAFDGAKDVHISNSRIISKDAFWNCENVVVTDSLIIGEYLGWNSKNITFIRCTVESNQGMCYMDGLTMQDCKLINTDLAFEYSSVDATVNSSILSVKNVKDGRICADSIGEIIIDENNRGSAEITERCRVKK